MRLGLDLRSVTDAADRRALILEADRLGLWAVLLGQPSRNRPSADGPSTEGSVDHGGPGTTMVEAAALAPHTASIHLGPVLDAWHEHPLTLAEELAVLDHLSARRALAVIDGPDDALDHIDGLLAGAVVDGVALAPPPAQTRLPVLALNEVVSVALTGDLDVDRLVIDDHRDGGITHLFVTWPGPLPALARHLATRAAGPDFPTVVATMADRIDPPG